MTRMVQVRNSRRGLGTRPATGHSARGASDIKALRRRLPVGAEMYDGGVHFRVWAPASKSVAVRFEDEGTGSRLVELQAESGRKGYFSGFIAEVAEGQLYRFQMEKGSFPDPASRFQPAGPHGPSQIVDPARFRWTDQQWRGVPADGQVIYEMHIGTFTPQGTWHAAMAELPELARAGITVLEVMPVADFPGEFGWGYDGVNLFAPTRLYGRPDELRAFVNRAHELGLGVILDVVYNHLGPDGNYLREFSPAYFSDKYENEWGDAMNFDGPGCKAVREFFVANAAYWIDEFHMDGLRIDATQQIYDASKVHIFHEIIRSVKSAARGRSHFVVAENEPQDSRLVRPPEENGYGFSALWNEDLHHSANVAVTGRREAYYKDYQGAPQELISAVKHGPLYQGQWYSWQAKRRGWPALDLRPQQIVAFLQNHDQVANSSRGYRLHQLTSPGRYRAITALFLLGPQTPMLFQGQEFAASAPFLYFADHHPELARKVSQGRRGFLEQFASVAGENGDSLAEPADPKTFAICKLDHRERERHAGTYDLHQDLLRLRRTDPVFSNARKGMLDGAVLAAEAFVLRFFGDGPAQRLLLINLGGDLVLESQPEPLLAPPAGMAWKIGWSSEDLRYGGCGTPKLGEGAWRIPAAAALVMTPEAIS